jgi:hypothetical protein
MSEPSIPALPLERFEHNVGDIPGDFQTVIRGGHLFVMPRVHFILSLEKITDAAGFLELVERTPEKFLSLAWSIKQIKAAAARLRQQLMESSLVSNPKPSSPIKSNPDADLDNEWD